MQETFDTEIARRFAAMLREDGHDNPAAWYYASRRSLWGIDVKGRSVLEVGSGRGLMALFLALQGARVYSMEPELEGSRSGMIAMQQRRAAELDLQNLEVVAADFNTWDPGPQRFDLVVSRSSINHLHASEWHALRHEPTYRGYLQALRKMHDVLEPHGTALITDASRYSFFGLTRELGVKRPWQLSPSNVNWRHHQSSRTWRRLCLDAGFRSVRASAAVPHRLRHVSKLASTRPVGFFLSGGILLRADA